MLIVSTYVSISTSSFKNANDETLHSILEQSIPNPGHNFKPVLADVSRSTFLHYKTATYHYIAEAEAIFF